MNSCAQTWLREPLAHHLIWTIALTVMIAALLWPAFWNSFPIVFDDTGGYLARPFEGSLLFGRSAFYGAFLALGIRLDFWPTIVAQSALAVWLVVVMLRTHGFGGRPLLAVAVIIGLSGLTSLPWFASQLMPDVFMPVAALAIYLLAFRAHAMQRGEKIVLGIVIAAAMASHMAALALSVATVAFLALVRPLRAEFRSPRLHLAPAALSVVLGVLFAPLSNLAIAGRFAFTPGGANFLFGRLVESGIVARYLSEKCPDPTIKLCVFSADLPATGDEWLWGEASPLRELGGTDGFAAEAQRIALTSLLLYPGQHLKTALTSATEQFFNVGNGYVQMPVHWHAKWSMERYAPEAIDAFLRSRQEETLLDLSWLSIVHAPIAYLAIAALPVVVIFACRRRIRPANISLLITSLAVLLANAAICGSFAVPADRYQNRLVPLAPLATGLVALGRWRLPSRKI